MTYKTKPSVPTSQKPNDMFCIYTTNKTTCFGFINNCLINKCFLESWKNMYMATVF